MIAPRIIARLDIKGPNLVKGIQLEGLRVLGRPGEFARHYFESGADELLYMDIVASLYDRANLLQIVEATSREVFIPLTVGGGLRSLDDIRAVLHAGADKVAINTAAIKRPSFIGEAARRFGSSTIVISIEAKRQPDGSYEAFVDNGRERTGVEVVDWARQAVAEGAGEIMVTSIDREGTGRGYDVDLVRRVADAVPVPVVACGGAGTPDHVRDVVEDGQANGAAVASMLHYRYIRDHAAQATGAAGAHPHLATRSSSRVAAATVGEIKSCVAGGGLTLRPAALDAVASGGDGGPVHRVAIIDYHMGNLFSVRRACEIAGLDAVITNDPQVAREADGIVLPGVGAFGDAMGALAQLGLVPVLKDAARAGTPFMGICLGIQLLMTESHEFGTHKGLGLVDGVVERLQEGVEAGRRAKVPHVGWNRLEHPAGAATWENSLLADNRPGDFMYFVHSYAVRPARADLVCAVANYGGQSFCAALQQDHVFACQFHPERSGTAGLKIYRKFAERVRRVSAGGRT